MTKLTHHSCRRGIRLVQMVVGDTELCGQNVKSSRALQWQGTVHCVEDRVKVGTSVIEVVERTKRKLHGFQSFPPSVIGCSCDT